MPIEPNLPPNPLRAEVAALDIPMDLDTPTPDGSVDIQLGPEEAPAKAPVTEHYANLAEHLESHELVDLATEVIKATEDDLASRSEWEQLIVRGIEELGLKIEEKSEPFVGACNATHPLLLENIVKFQAKAIHEMIPESGPARTRIWGTSNEEKEKRSRRMSEYLNYTILERMVEYYDETERLLFALPLIGSAFKKTYYDTGLARPVGEFVSAEHFVVSYNAADLRRAERYTHLLYRTDSQYESDVAGGVYLDRPPQLAQVRQAQAQDRLVLPLQVRPRSRLLWSRPHPPDRLPRRDGHRHHALSRGRRFFRNPAGRLQGPWPPHYWRRRPHQPR